MIQMIKQQNKRRLHHNLKVPKFNNVQRWDLPQQVWSLHWGMDEKTKRIVEKMEAPWVDFPVMGRSSCDIWFLEQM